MNNDNISIEEVLISSNSNNNYSTVMKYVPE